MRTPPHPTSPAMHQLDQLAEQLRIRRWTFEDLDIDRLRTRILRRDHDLYGRLIDAAQRREPHTAEVAVWVLAPHLVEDARRWHGGDRTAALDHRVTIASMVIADVTDTAAPYLIERVLSRSRRRTIRATLSERGQPTAVVSLADHALGHFDEPDPTARAVTARIELTRVLDTAQQAVAAGRINAADWDLLLRKAVTGRQIGELTDLEPGPARTAIFRARSTLRTLV